MGFSTAYLGRLDIEPRLNAQEVEWLRAYARTHRPFHPDDPYAVPMNPGAEHLHHPASSPLPGGGYALPSGPVTGLDRCDWQPCVDGCCLVWDKVEKSNAAARELRYLVDHFLRPDAHAATDGRDDFAPFTFDHHVSGVIAAERDDTRELFLVVADDNSIEERTLVPGDPQWW